MLQGFSCCKRRPLPAGRQSAGTHAFRLNSGCTGCTKSFGGGAAVSLMVLSDELSSLPAATCASFVQPVGTFLVPSGKKLMVSAGHAADASCTEAAGQRSATKGREGVACMRYWSEVELVGWSCVCTQLLCLILKHVQKHVNQNLLYMQFETVLCCLASPEKPPVADSSRGGPEVSLAAMVCTAQPQHDGGRLNIC